MTPSRIALGAALLAVPLLAGCGRSDEISPHANACRVYELQVGQGAKVLVDDVRSFLDQGGGDSDTLTTEMKVARESAVNAALTKNLPDQDFRRFKAVVDSSDTLTLKMASYDGTASIGAFVSAYEKALDAVTKSCA